MRFRRPRFARSALSIALASTLAAPASAQMLEEVLVTATKRPVGMQDVPIALSVMSSEKITEQGIGSLADIAIFMPNVHIAEASAGDQLFIRGVGSGINYAFEQSVGTFIDGVYFGRGQASRSTFLDLERVEVLKGSQSTLFGKNTIAGAINITTARPGDEFEAIIDYTAEPEFDGQSATLTVSGPITDTFGARLVLKGAETDGWMDNKYLGEDEVSKDDLVGRVTLVWDALDELVFTFKYETGESEATGSNEVISIATPEATSIYQGVDPNFSAEFGYDKSDANFGYDPITGTSGGVRGGDTYHDSEWDIFTLTAEWDVGDYTIKSITGYVDYQFDNYRDSDYSALQAIGRGRDESHEQFTQEFLLTSPAGETFEYLAGLYYQDEELGHERYTDVSLSSLVDAGVEFIVNGNDQTALVGSGIADATGNNFFNQDAETWSAFFQGTYHISDTLRVIAGIRYSDDTKEFDKGGTVATLLDDGSNTSQATADLLSAIYDGTLELATRHSFANGMGERCPAVTVTTIQCDSFAINTEREEDHTTGDITVQWDATADMMVYAKWGNGYKAGGFDEDNGRGYVDAQEYEDESSDTIEVGAKMDVFDGRGRFNVAVFKSEYDDVQVSTFDGNAGFVVGNAAETEVEGVEIDGMFAITEELRVTMALAYLDAKYGSFPNAGCTSTQTTIFAAGADGISGTADDQVPGECTQDLSGQRLQFAADWSGNLAINYSTPVTDNLEFISSLDVLFSDDYDTAADGDELLGQDEYAKINARIALAEMDGKWSVAILGKNLTDVQTTTWGNDIPLGGFGFADSYFQIIDAPRSFELQARYRF
jgi:iron complex outermembrane recepter protein